MLYYLKGVHNKNEILFVACVYLCTYCSEDYDCTLGFKSPMVNVPVLLLIFYWSIVTLMGIRSVSLPTCRDRQSVA